MWATQHMHAGLAFVHAFLQGSPPAHASDGDDEGDGVQQGAWAAAVSALAAGGAGGGAAAPGSDEAAAQYMANPSANRRLRDRRRNRMEKARMLRGEYEAAAAQAEKARADPDTAKAAKAAAILQQLQQQKVREEQELACAEPKLEHYLDDRDMAMIKLGAWEFWGPHALSAEALPDAAQRTSLAAHWKVIGIIYSLSSKHPKHAEPGYSAEEAKSAIDFLDPDSAAHAQRTPGERACLLELKTSGASGICTEGANGAGFDITKHLSSQAFFMDTMLGVQAASNKGRQFLNARTAFEQKRAAHTAWARGLREEADERASKAWEHELRAAEKAKDDARVAYCRSKTEARKAKANHMGRGNGRTGMHMLAGDVAFSTDEEDEKETMKEVKERLAKVQLANKAPRRHRVRVGQGVVERGYSICPMPFSLQFLLEYKSDCE